MATGNDSNSSSQGSQPVLTTTPSPGLENDTGSDVSIWPTVVAFSALSEVLLGVAILALQVAWAAMGDLRLISVLWTGPLVSTAGVLARRHNHNESEKAVPYVIAFCLLSTPIVLVSLLFALIIGTQETLSGQRFIVCGSLVIVCFLALPISVLGGLTCWKHVISLLQDKWKKKETPTQLPVSDGYVVPVQRSLPRRFRKPRQGLTSPGGSMQLDVMSLPSNNPIPASVVPLSDQVSRRHLEGEEASRRELPEPPLGSVNPAFTPDHGSEHRSRSRRNDSDEYEEEFILQDGYMTPTSEVLGRAGRGRAGRQISNQENDVVIYNEIPSPRDISRTFLMDAGTTAAVANGGKAACGDDRQGEALINNDTKRLEINKESKENADAATALPITTPSLARSDPPEANLKDNNSREGGSTGTLVSREQHEVIDEFGVRLVVTRQQTHSRPANSKERRGTDRSQDELQISQSDRDTVRDRNKDATGCKTKGKCDGPIRQDHQRPVQKCGESGNSQHSELPTKINKSTQSDVPHQRKSHRAVAHLDGSMSKCETQGQLEVQHTEAFPKTRAVMETEHCHSQKETALKEIDTSKITHQNTNTNRLNDGPPQIRLASDRGDSKNDTLGVNDKTVAACSVSPREDASDYLEPVQRRVSLPDTATSVSMPTPGSPHGQPYCILTVDYEEVHTYQELAHQKQ